ncbi:hypothetical protein ACSNOK_25550 [Streptomyces sp. URMC 126]|uniref:hypothetical protein n=1 Tax=Streptomyces sp. URMC 126 TaxID=3423401 RepID=UPI003F1E0300
MLIVDIVLETADTTGFTAWPVAGLPPYRPLALSGGMTPDEVGAAMAALTAHTLGSSADGGLRFHHTGLGITVRPGCCSDLADWRAWSALADGELPWWGHDPTPRVELTGTTVRLWPDGGFAAEPPPTRPIEIPVADLPGVLCSVGDDLRGFLTLTRQWAAAHVPDLADELTTRLNTDLTITAPPPTAPAVP